MYQARPHQSLSTHEQEGSRTMSTLLAPLGLSQFGALIGGMHDFGKMSADFQQYMDALSQHIMLIGFNPKFLIDALRVIDDEEVDLYFMNAKAPCFIKDENQSYII